MNQILQTYATRAVPRYTSYPTVPHFSPSIGTRDYAAWLRDLDPAEPISLYLHVPFCRQLCWYCGCNMKLASRAAPIAQYAETLAHEIDLVADHLPGRMTLGHLHWGGGTPTVLTPEDLERLMHRILARFDLATGAELAIESDPRTLGDAMIARIGRLGFTRASFGVQEFDPKVQKAINRIQPPEMVRRAVDGLRGAGVGGINFDLIYGLPHQTVETLVETIGLSLAMQPDRIAMFGYAHVPWMAKKQRLIDPVALPGPADRLAQAKAAEQAIVAAGYIAIGLDHFARPQDPLAGAAASGQLHRNFQGYTTDDAPALLGLGASSIGRTPQGYVQNLTETGAWARAVQSGILPVAKGHGLTAEDRMRGEVIEALMCLREADLPGSARRHGLDPDWFADALPGLKPLIRDGLVRWNSGRMRVTAAGRPLARVAAAAFDAYLQPQPQPGPQSQRQSQPARHSVAV